VTRFDFCSKLLRRTTLFFFSVREYSYSRNCRRMIIPPLLLSLLFLIPLYWAYCETEPSSTFIVCSRSPALPPGPRRTGPSYIRRGVFHVFYPDQVTAPRALLLSSACSAFTTYCLKSYREGMSWLGHLMMITFQSDDLCTICGYFSRRF